MKKIVYSPLESLKDKLFWPESNNSHLIVVPVDTLEFDEQYLREYCLKVWRKEDRSVDINIELNENLLQEGRFTEESFIPHFSINDKLLYAYATIVQHFVSLLVESSETSNKLQIRNFETLIKESEKQIAQRLQEGLFNKTSLENNSKIKLKFKYSLKDDLLDIFDSDTKFYTGCRNNEEFYAAVCSNPYELSKWICNPYSAILAGSEKQSLEETKKMYRLAEKLLSLSWQSYKASKIKSLFRDNFSKNLEDCPNLILNPGKVIFCGDKYEY